MADSQRLEDLRRRVQQDPSSIAFAQLGEEYRRAGQAQDAADVCRAGLAIHPTYLSARVTLGRALLDLTQFDEAQQELELVLRSAPENLAAIRGLAEIHHRRGSLGEALAQYRAALALARNDPDLEQTVKDLAGKVEPQQPAHAGGLSFEQVTRELSVHTPPAPPPAAPVAPAAVVAAVAVVEPVDHVEPVEPIEAVVEPVELVERVERVEPVELVEAVEAVEVVEPVEPVEPVELVEPVEAAEDVKTEAPAMRTIAALEQWLHAIHVTRAERHA